MKSVIDFILSLLKLPENPQCMHVDGIECGHCCACGKHIEDFGYFTETEINEER